MRPERRISKMVRRYDPHLFIKWNEKKKYFELWRRQAIGSVLITPVTESIYDTSRPITFTPLDERLMWWIYEADTWRSSPKKHALEGDRRWKEFQQNFHKGRKDDARHLATDLWNGMNNYFVKSYQTKNQKPKFENYKKQAWINPSSQKKAISKRLFSRSPGNAKLYNFRGI